MDACPGEQAIQDRKRRGKIRFQKSGEAQSKCGGRGGSKDTEGDGKRSSKLLNGGAGFR